jgi:hypothetical protein
VKRRCEVYGKYIKFIPEEGIEKRDREGLDGRFGGHWSAVCVGVRFVSLPSAKRAVQAGGRDGMMLPAWPWARGCASDSMVTNGRPKEQSDQHFWKFV